MNWLKYRYLYFVISLLIIIPGVYSLFRYGLNLSIEFTGGTSLTIKNIEPVSQSSLLLQLDKYHPQIESQTDKTLSLKLDLISKEEINSQIQNLEKDNSDINLSEFESVGPVIGKETIKKTVTAILLSALLLLIFISSTFKQLKYGVCAVLAMFHDTLVLLGTFSLLGHFYHIQIDLLFVTAMLTILSFSVHDTIVVYDRIRELGHRLSTTNFVELANIAVNETMIRSLNNSLTIIFMLLAMFLMGGDTTKYFALALLIGTISGTYSSPFTAVPLLVVWDSFSHRHNSRK